MSLIDDPRRLEAKAIPVADVIHRLGIARLTHTGCEMVGPCPLCGGRDRFGVNLRTNKFLCRKCGITGGDQIKLVEHVLGVDFKAALSYLCGEAVPVADHAQMEARRAAAKRAAAKQDAETEKFRQAAIDDARKIWHKSTFQAEGLVRDYLSARGITPEGLPEIPRVLRFLPNHTYLRRVAKQTVRHTGPAMIAVVQSADGVGRAVHQTWIDVTRPKGKAEIMFDGKAQPVKLVRGSKKGGAIRLITPPDCTTLVMGEGIETTLTAAAADAVPGAAYWAGVDLGNMAGLMVRGPRRGTVTGAPDMSDDRAFVPPEWVRRLILIQDGDSDPDTTRAQLLSCARRAMALRPGLSAQIVHAGAGLDLNDLVLPECEGQ